MSTCTGTLLRTLDADPYSTRLTPVSRGPEMCFSIASLPSLSIGQWRRI
jgi:hypothetical protein